MLLLGAQLSGSVEAVLLLVAHRTAILTGTLNLYFFSEILAKFSFFSDF